jgi:hypothetical protein
MGALLSDHINFQTLLQTTVAPRATFGIQLFLVDDEQIPIDTRFRYVTNTSWDTDLTSGTVPYAYSGVFFGQDLVPETLMLGRWAKAATSPKFVCGAGYEKTLATWVAETAGSFKVVDNAGTPNEDEVTGVSFAAATSLAQVATILTTAIQAIATPNITGLDTSEFIFDALDRLVLVMSTTGDAAAQVSITTAASGSDISVPLLDAPNGTTTAGLDAEDPEDAVAAIKAIDDSFYNIGIRGESAAQQLSLATYIETQKKLLDLVSIDPNADDPAATSDIGYLLQQLSAKRTLVIYTEQFTGSDITDYPDAAAAGRFLPADEGTTQYEWQSLNLISQSGSPTPLSASERTALTAKNYSYIETYSNGTTILYNGLTAGGIEKRIMLGRDWFVARNTEAIWTYQVNTPLAAFDNPTLTALEGIIWTWANEAITRRILVNTKDRPFTVTLPDADDISQSERASHTFTELDAYNGYLNSAIHDYRIVGTWTI